MRGKQTQVVEIYPMLELQFQDVELHNLIFDLSNASRLYATPKAKDPILGAISANLVDQIVTTESAELAEKNTKGLSVIIKTVSNQMTQFCFIRTYLYEYISGATRMTAPSRMAEDQMAW